MVKLSPDGCGLWHSLPKSIGILHQFKTSQNKNPLVQRLLGFPRRKEQTALTLPIFKLEKCALHQNF
jgi:hypothetical protein